MSRLRRILVKLRRRPPAASNARALFEEGGSGRWHRSPDRKVARKYGRIRLRRARIWTRFGAAGAFRCRCAEPARDRETLECFAKLGAGLSRLVDSLQHQAKMRQDWRWSNAGQRWSNFGSNRRSWTGTAPHRVWVPCVLEALIAPCAPWGARSASDAGALRPESHPCVHVGQWPVGAASAPDWVRARRRHLGARPPCLPYALGPRNESAP